MQTTILSIWLIQSILIHMDSDGQMVNGDISIFGGFVHIYMQRHAFKV